ncbi:hypothetical protein DsansV1_C16g0141001 [Dioscorea sansibarensis]
MELVGDFFKVASKMLNEEGQVHVSHRDDYPYRLWRIEDLANDAELVLKEKEVFSKCDYPGYNNKRGSGVLSDNEFPLKDSFTFMFSLDAELVLKEVEFSKRDYPGYSNKRGSGVLISDNEFPLKDSIAFKFSLELPSETSKSCISTNSDDQDIIDDYD